MHALISRQWKVDNYWYSCSTSLTYVWLLILGWWSRFVSTVTAQRVSQKLKCTAPRVLCSWVMTGSGRGKRLHQLQNRSYCMVQPPGPLDRLQSLRSSETLSSPQRRHPLEGWCWFLSNVVSEVVPGRHGTDGRGSSYLAILAVPTRPAVSSSIFTWSSRPCTNRGHTARRIWELSSPEARVWVGATRHPYGGIFHAVIKAWRVPM